MDRTSLTLVGGVVTFHLLFFFFNFGINQAPPLPKKSIIVRTLSPLPSTQPVSTCRPLKPINGPKSPEIGQSCKGPPSKKRSRIQKKGPSNQNFKEKKEILKKVEQSLKKMDAPSSFQELKDPVPLPLKIPHHFEIDQKPLGQTEGYLHLLATSLKEALELPERGNVKLALTVQNSGIVLKLNVIESASDTNRKYLESALLKMRLPPFCGDLKCENEQTWILTFCNET